MARPRFVALALALLTLLLYLPVRKHAFLVYDDPDYITQNRVVQAGLTWQGVEWAATTWHANNWHPLTWLSHMADCEIFGVDPAAHHLVNVLFHCLNAVLVLLVLWRFTGALWTSALVAALFAWHPLHVQSVAWAAERKDVLSTLFFWLTLLAYAKYARAGVGGKSDGATARWLAVSLLLFGLGLASKPMLVTLPFVLLLLDYWPLERFKGKSLREALLELVREKLPFFALSAAACVVTFLAQRAEAVIGLEPHPIGSRLANAVVSYARYLEKTIWPAELSVIYPLPKSWPLWVVAASAAVLCVISVLAWRARRTRPHLLVGWLWFLGTLVPVIGIVQVGGQAMADRYTYLPLTGVLLAIAVEAKLILDRWKLAPAAPAILALIVLGACMGATHFELRYWRDSETLFARALSVTTNNAIAHANLGVALEEQNRRDEALREYREAVRIDPSLVQAQNNLGNLLDESGQPEEALAHYREAVRLKPRAAMAHANLGALLSRLGRHEEATRELSEAITLSGRDPRPYYLYAKALLRAGRTPQALDRFRNALKIDPDDVQTLTWLARVLAAHPEASVRDGAEAVRLAERANTLTGGRQPYVLDTLAMAYAEAGRLAEAKDALRKAIEIAAAAGEAEAAGAMRERLGLYEAGRPYREEFTAVTK